MRALALLRVMRRGRPLPEPDATIAELDAPARAALELEGAAAFAAVTQALVELQADARIVDLAARAVSEEIRHAEIYRDLARAYAPGSVTTAADGGEPSRAQWGRWRAQIATLPPLTVPVHACPSPSAIERASIASIRDLVLPGFARAGVDVREAGDWAARLG